MDVPDIKANAFFNSSSDGETAAKMLTPGAAISGCAKQKEMRLYIVTAETILSWFSFSALNYKENTFSTAGEKELGPREEKYARVVDTGLPSCVLVGLILTCASLLQYQHMIMSISASMVIKISPSLMEKARKNVVPSRTKVGEDLHANFIAYLNTWEIIRAGMQGSAWIFSNNQRQNTCLS